MRRYVFRLDANPRLGMGHLRRCLAVAQALKDRGNAEIHFVSDAANSPGCIALAHPVVDAWIQPGRQDAMDFVRQARAVGADALVLDHYGVDEAYQQILLASGIPWLQFQVLPNQKLWSDWVVAPSPAAIPEAYRRARQRPASALLLGPAYAPIRPEFQLCRRERACPERIARLAVTFGGGDDRGAAIVALSAWRLLPSPPQLSLLTTSANPRLAEISAWIGEHGGGKVVLAVDAPDFAGRLAEADLAITAGGTTLYETAFLGVPVLVVRIADNQDENAAAWQRLGVAKDAGSIAECRAEDLAGLIDHLDRDRQDRCRMSREGMHQVDGRGAFRIAEAIAGETSAA